MMNKGAKCLVDGIMPAWQKGIGGRIAYPHEPFIVRGPVTVPHDLFPS